MYVVYILLCNDDSLYTGITNNLHQRFAKHVAGTASKYTRSHGVQKIVYTENKRTHGAALRREAAIKQLSRKQKQQLIAAALDDAI